MTPAQTHDPVQQSLDAAIASLTSAPVLDVTPTRFQLANGLQLLVLEDHRAPVIAHSLWYRAGSIDESSGVTGIAHVLEHMMFNGTHRYGPGEYDKQMRALGAYANALTWTDYTAYTIEAPASRLADVMELEAERMTDLNITDAEFEREIRVVMEERRQSSDDDPAGLLYESLYASAFHASPQRWPIIGWMSDLESMRADDARAWYARWYRPDNAVLVVAGDVDPAAVCALATKHFGHVEAGGGTLRRTQQEPLQRGTRRVETFAHIPTPQIAIGFKVPRLIPSGSQVQAVQAQAVQAQGVQAEDVQTHEGQTNDDVFALAILAELLDWGRILETRLVRQRRLADETWASYDYLMRAPGLFTIGAVCAQDVSPTRVERGLRAAIDAIAQDGVDESALRRVRTQLISARLYRSDSVFEQADEWGKLAMLGLADEAHAIDARLMAVSAADVQRVAAHYFSPETMTVAVLMPIDDGDEADDSDDAADPDSADADHADPVDSAEDPDTERAHDNGRTPRKRSGVLS